MHTKIKRFILGLVKKPGHYYMINHRPTRPLVYEGQAVAQIRIQKQAKSRSLFSLSP